MTITMAVKASDRDSNELQFAEDNVTCQGPCCISVFASRPCQHLLHIRRNLSAEPVCLCSKMIEKGLGWWIMVRIRVMVTYEWEAMNSTIPVSGRFVHAYQRLPLHYVIGFLVQGSSKEALRASSVIFCLHFSSKVKSDIDIVWSDCLFKKLVRIKSKRTSWLWIRVTYLVRWACVAYESDGGVVRTGKKPL